MRESKGPKGAYRTFAGIAAASAVTVVVAGLAFFFRFNSLGGILGGLSDDHFATLSRVELLLDGQHPLRDFAEAELRGAWPSLSYLVPAWAQQIGGRSLLSEAYLAVGTLAIAQAILFLLALAFSKRWSVALLVAGLAIATGPKLYNYPKVLLLTLGAMAIRATTLTPSWTRLASAAALTAVAVLFRHDYGVYIATGLVAGLVARDLDQWRLALRRVGSYVGLTALCLAPSAVWVQAYEGIPSYVRNALLAVNLESRRTQLQLPPIDPFALSNVDTLAVLTYYGFWLVVALAAAVLVWCWVRPSPGSTREARATAAGLLAMAAIVSASFLRSNLTQRFGDAVAAVALLAAWTIGSSSAIESTAARRLTVAVSSALLLAMFLASCVFNDVVPQMRAAGLLHSWAQTTLRFEQARDNLRSLPPVDWSRVEPGGTLSVARYINQCTSPNDYVLVTGYAPEVTVLARRRFAAGQGTVSLGFYTSEEDQRRALTRLARQSVPIVLAESREFEEGFVSDYPLLARHLFDHYREAGTILVGGEPQYRVFVESARTPKRVDGELGLPCFR